MIYIIGNGYRNTHDQLLVALNYTEGISLHSSGLIINHQGKKNSQGSIFVEKIVWASCTIHLWVCM